MNVSIYFMSCNSLFIPHTELSCNGTVFYGTLLGYDYFANDAHQGKQREYLEIRINTTEEENQRLLDRLNRRRSGEILSLKNTCSGSVMEVLEQERILRKPYVFNQLPFLNTAYLCALYVLERIFLSKDYRVVGFYFHGDSKCLFALKSFVFLPGEICLGLAFVCSDIYGFSSSFFSGLLNSKVTNVS